MSNKDPVLALMEPTFREKDGQYIRALLFGTYMFIIVIFSCSIDAC